MPAVGLLLQLLLAASASAELSFDNWYDPLATIYNVGKQYSVISNQRLDPVLMNCFLGCIHDRYGKINKNSGRQCKDQCLNTWGGWIGSWLKSAADRVEFAEVADPPSWKNALTGYIEKPDTFPAGNTLVLNINQAEDLGELVGASWVFLVRHLHPNARTNQQFLVLDKDSLFELHSLLKARISDDLVSMKAPPTLLGFQVSSTTAGLGLVSLTTMLVLWKRPRQDEDNDDLEEARSRRRGMRSAFLGDSLPSEQASRSSDKCFGERPKSSTS